VRHALLFWVAAWLLLGCAHRFNRDVRDRGKEETKERWQTAATAEQQQQRAETKKEQATGFRRVTRKLPTGEVIVDESWSASLSELNAWDGRVSRSASTAAGEAERKKEHDRNAKTGSATSWWPPLWMWLLSGLAIVVVIWYLRKWWRARRILPL
jgi:hypothetical protein